MDSASIAVIIIIAITITICLLERNKYTLFTIIAGLTIAFFASVIMTGGDNMVVIRELGASSDNIRNFNNLWCLMTAEFVHIDIFHLLFNMIFLFFIGQALIHCINSVKFTLLFIFGGMIPALITSFLYDNIVLVGSSSSIATLAGITFVLPYMRTVIFDKTNNPRLCMRALILLWIVGECCMVIFYYNGPSTISYMDHLFGFAVGIAIGLLSSASYPENEGKKCITAVMDLERLDLPDIEKKKFIIENPICPVCNSPVVVKNKTMVCKKGHDLFNSKFNRGIIPK